MQRSGSEDVIDLVSQALLNDTVFNDELVIQFMTNTITLVMCLQSTSFRNIGVLFIAISSMITKNTSLITQPFMKSSVDYSSKR